MKSRYKIGKASVFAVEEQLAPLQVKILKVLTNLDAQIKSWERDFIVKNNLSMPTTKDKIDDPIICNLENRKK